MLIGRDAERQTLARLVGAARLSRGGALLLVGEAGIGKSALLGELAAASGGLRMLWVHGCAPEQGVAFSGLEQLVRPLRGLLDGLPAPQAEALATALALSCGPAPDRLAVHAGVLSLLTTAAAEEPVLVLVDDAHLLDQTSAAALLFVARRVAAERVAVAIASRPSGSVLLDAGLPRLTVPGLGPAEVRALLTTHTGQPVPTALAARVHAATAGNPLAVVTLARSWETVEAQTPAAPISVRGAAITGYANRALALPPRARHSLLVAALASDSGEATAALERLGLSLAEADAAETAGLVTLCPGGVTFQHPLARAAVCVVASAGQRREAHRAIAAVTSDPDRRAWHRAEGAVGLDDEVADDVAQAARRASDAGAHAVAATGYARAAALSTAGGVQARRLLAASEAAALAGQGDRAAALVERAAAVSHEPADQARIDAAQAVLEQRWGSLACSRTLAERALGILATTDPSAAVTTSADLLGAALALGDGAAADRTAVLLEWLEPHCSPEVAVRARMVGAVARERAGPGAQPVLREWLAGWAEDGRSDPFRRQERVLGTLVVQDWSGLTAPVLDRAAWLREEGLALGWAAPVLLQVARCAVAANRWPEAAEHYRAGIEAARACRQENDLALLSAGLAGLEARTGAGTCRGHAEEALRLAGADRVPLAQVWARAALGDLELGAGRADQALRHYRAVADLVAAGHFSVDLDPGPEIVDGLLRLSPAAEAAAEARRCRDAAERAGGGRLSARVARAGALTSASPAVELARALAEGDGEDRFEDSRTHLALGQALRRGRQRVAARKALRAALAGFDALGAHPWTERAAAELEATGAHAHRRGEGTIDLLTPQELQVARLLAAGRTTRQAAAALFLSPKTIEYHLRHVYTKLDVHDRSALTAALREQ
ncbi:LuxR family transcriptional regulator [Nocardioides dubius]|uniref:LuxR family transcriptional regulator n=1 Tax=Nocardioides dubius TaxID=317019 RepID=A0ABN1TMP2_9ACTN